MATATVVRTDEEIQKNVMAELKWEAQIQPNEIGVSVKDGIVTLTGWVDSFLKKWSAENAALKVVDRLGSNDRLTLIRLGAQPEDVFRTIVGEGLRLAVAGVGAGIVAALAMTRLLQSFLYGVSAYDPVTFLGVAMLLTIVAAAASFFPARRATLVDPLVALRYE